MRIEGEMNVLVGLFHYFLPKWFCGYEPNAIVFKHSPIDAEPGCLFLKHVIIMYTL